MQIKIQSKLLKAFLKNLALVVPQRSTLPILEYLLAEIWKNGVRFTATNLEETLEAFVYKLDCDVTGYVAEAALIPCRPLMKAVQSCKATDYITIASREKTIAENTTYFIDVEFGGVVTSLDSGDPKNFPDQLPSAFEYGLSEKVNLDILKTALTFSSTDESRPAMCGVYLSPKGYISTDGYRLFADESSTFQQPVILPNSAINITTRLGLDTLHLAVNYNAEKNCKPYGKFLSFATTDEKHPVEYKLYFKIVEESFLNYEAVIPTTFFDSVTFDRTAMLEKCKPLVSTEKRLVKESTLAKQRIIFFGGMCTVRIYESNDSIAAETALPCRETIDYRTGVSMGYVVDVLSGLREEIATMEFDRDRNDRAVIFREKKRFILLMPVRLQLENDITDLDNGPALVSRLNFHLYSEFERKKYPQIDDGNGTVTEHPMMVFDALWERYKQESPRTNHDDSPTPPIGPTPEPDFSPAEFEDDAPRLGDTVTDGTYTGTLVEYRGMRCVALADGQKRTFTDSYHHALRVAA